MTFAVPGVMPAAHAANANLFVSAENSQFDNYMSGPQVIEVVVIDSDINDTDEAKGEPDVTVNGKIIRMVQAVDGNWYGYFADETMANVADATVGTPGQGLDFGTIEDDEAAAGTLIGTGATFFSDANAVAYQDGDLNVVREAKLANTNVAATGQIDIDDTYWPFIQLYPLNPTGNVVVQYNKGGGAQTTTLTFDSVDQFAGAELDKSSYGQGDEVHVTVTDLWLNIDPTDEDSWTFGTTGTGSSSDATTHYQVFNENGNAVGNSAGNTDNTLTNALDDLMCEDNCRMLTTADVQSKGFVITLDDNDDSEIVNEDHGDDAFGNADGINPQNPLDWEILGGFQGGNVPVTITEQGPNSGVFGSYDESDDSNIKITSNAKRGTSASIDYNETPATVLVAFAFGSINIDLVDDEWNSGEEISVVLVDADANLNSRADEDLDLNNPDVALIPSLKTGSPATLRGMVSSGNTIGSSAASLDGVPLQGTVQAFSQRALLTSSLSASDIAISGGEVLSLDFGSGTDFFNAAPIDDNPDTVTALFNYDIRSVVDATGADDVDVSLCGNTIATGADAQDLILIPGGFTCSDLDADFTLNGADTDVPPGLVMPVVADIFGFRFY
jgi:hypothetical protein